jgi:hypothetical protein
MSKRIVGRSGRPIVAEVRIARLVTSLAANATTASDASALRPNTRGMALTLVTTERGERATNPTEEGV